MPISKNYLYKEIKGEGMLIPINNGDVDMTKVLNLNDVGSVVYKGLLNGNTVDEIISIIAAEYDAPLDVIEADVNSFVEELKTRGIYNE